MVYGLWVKHSPFNDPSESVNLADNKDYQSLVAELHEQLVVLRENR
tara:strand:- start:276 stop:413 length:138 start_codon:yes stop_codon:yes gene_type:complete